MQPIVRRSKNALLLFARAMVSQRIHRINFPLGGLHGISEHAHRCEHAQAEPCSQDQSCTGAFTVVSMCNESEWSD